MNKKLLLFALIIALLSQSTALAYTKDEVVYTTLKSNGKVNETVIVNDFKLNGENSITDYGDYKNLKNLSSTAKPHVTDGRINYSTKGLNEFYYQGTKTGGELPWTFDISYKLDNKPITGEKLIGKSGKVEMKIDVKLNPKANDYYKNNYLVQITSTLDTEICQNIVCDDAIAADVGSNKQLTLMVLPTRSKTFTITFDAKKFEMDGLTIAMVKLSDGILGNTLDNASVTISSVTSGIEALLDGSGQLKNGADDLVTAVGLIDSASKTINNTMTTVVSGADDLSSGASQLEGGVDSLSSGSSQIRSGLFALDGKSITIANGISSIEGGLKQMSGNTAKIKSGVDELKGKKSQIDTLTSSGKQLTDGYDTVYNGISQIADGYEDATKAQATLDSEQSEISALPTQTAQLKQMLNAVYDLLSQDANSKALAQYKLNAQAIYNALNTYIDSSSASINTLYSGANEAVSNLVTITQGAKTLQSGMGTLNSGLEQYVGGAGSILSLYNSALLFGNTAYSLSSGADKLYAGSKTLSSGFGQYADGVGELATGSINLDDGISTLKTGVYNLTSGATSLSNGLGTLGSVVDELDSGIGKLASSANALPEGANSLENGTKQLFDGVSTVDIANMISKGANQKAVSFASPGVAKAEKVQFLIKTPNLKIDETKQTEEETESQGFWAKLLALFGIK